MWDVWIDTGGTFTDALAHAPNGETRRAKVLSSSMLRLPVEAGPAAGVPGRTFRLAAGQAGGMAPLPDGFLVGVSVGLPGKAASSVVKRHVAGEITLTAPLPARDVLEGRAPCEAPILAAHVLLGVPCTEALPPLHLRLATTRGTNALLEGRLAPVALFITRGFEDLLTIGDQTRPDLFALEIRRPAPPYRACFPLAHRLDAAGREIVPLDERRLRADARDAIAAGCTHAAVAILHAWRAPECESHIAQVLREAGFSHVSTSAGLTPEIGLLARAQTAVINAAVAPEIEGFVERVRASLAPGSTLRVMTSAGALALPESLAPKDTLLSGPAGGYIGAIDGAGRSGTPRVLTFDMGGTSTDVARSEGDRLLVSRHGVGTLTVLAPAVAVESVAAGGGSICTVRAGMLRVGPESAGARPGPACYGAGGPLALTDVNLLLGHLDPARFAFPLRVGDAERALEVELARARDEVDATLSRGALLRAFRDLADDAVAGALRAISTRQGCDPREYALLAFGGAGGQHACAVASRLGMREVIIPPDQSLLSARGLGVTGLERIRRVQVLRLLGPRDAWLGAEVASAIEEVTRELERDESAAALAHGDVSVDATVFARAPGQEHSLPIELTPGECGPGMPAARVIDAFVERYTRLFAHPPSLGGAGADAVEVEALRVRATHVRPGAGAPPEAAALVAAMPAPGGAGPRVVERAALTAPVQGPALIREEHTLTVVEQGWTAERLACGALRLRHETIAADHTARDMPLDVFAARLGAIATDMGELLRRTAISVNIRERVDYSCAVLDAEGELIVNAPHVPVHLGGLGVCVREVVRTLPLGPGEVAITNHPAFGGSHLPDVTLIAPAHRGGVLLGYVAARAHHAEIGGIAPGSMSAAARTLAEESCVIPPMRLVTSGGHAFGEVERVLCAAPWPTRALRDNLADVKAALAACVRGREGIEALGSMFTPELLQARFEAIKQRASERLRLALVRRGPFDVEVCEQLDDGPLMRARLRSDGDALDVDFTGTGPVHPSTLNATPAIVRSVVMYALRVLLGEDAPLNEGLMRRARVVLPPCFLSPHFESEPAFCPAVGAGNVETSQRLANALIRALSLCAESQGTMNNVLIGGEGWATYETLGGGAGAGPGFHGASCVHTHMTNTRLTDPETIEHRFPIQIIRFARRHGSGGRGAFTGGDGIIREYSLRANACITLLTQRRARGASGAHGGDAGSVGRQCVIDPHGLVTHLGARTTLWANAGDRLVIETPGGGGWGTPSE